MLINAFNGHACVKTLETFILVGLITDFLIDGRRSLIWEVRLGVRKSSFQYITLTALE